MAYSYTKEVPVSEFENFKKSMEDKYPGVIVEILSKHNTDFRVGLSFPYDKLKTSTKEIRMVDYEDYKKHIESLGGNTEILAIHGGNYLVGIKAIDEINREDLSGKGFGR